MSLIVEALAPLLPMHGIRVAQQEQAVAFLEREQHIELIGRDIEQQRIPRLVDLLIGKSGSIYAAYRVMKLLHRHRAPFKVLQVGTLPVRVGELVTHLHSQAGKCLGAAVLVEVYEHAAPVEEYISYHNIFHNH